MLGFAPIDDKIPSIIIIMPYPLSVNYVYIQRCFVFFTLFPVFLL